MGFQVNTLAHTDQTIIDQLKQSHLFSCLSDKQLDDVYRHCEIVKLDEGEMLFSQGEDVRNFYLVLSGKIKLFRLSQDGQEKIINIVSSGEIFAEALMFMDQPHYPVNSGALKEAAVVGIDIKNFKNMLYESVDTCMLLLGAMSFRLHELIHEIDVLTLRNATCRVAAYMLQNSPENQNTFALEVPKGVIAARLSVKPETFSRIIKNLKDDGVLNMQGSKITINDRSVLKQMCLD